MFLCLLLGLSTLLPLVNVLFWPLSTTHKVEFLSRALEHVILEPPWWRSFRTSLIFEESLAVVMVSCLSDFLTVGGFWLMFVSLVSIFLNVVEHFLSSTLLVKVKRSQEQSRG